ncbi:MAG: response regulator [Defluviitaleaceae bacterium]|nr:response regulator [Defluviitaleaceae bacterium]
MQNCGPRPAALAVDDMPTNLAAAKNLLRRCGFEAYAAASGPEAVEAVRKEEVRFGIILMDYFMPGMNGGEAARQIKNIGTDYAKNVPIISVTADTDAHDEIFLRENGFCGYLTKPIQITQLEAAVNKWAGPTAAANGHAEKNFACQKIYISGLETQKGIELFGGDADGYLSVLRSFALSSPPMLDKITAADFYSPEYLTTVHGLAGTCRGVCANEAAEMAAALETAAKEKNFGYIKKNNACFVEAAQKILINIENFFSEAETGQDKKLLEKPDEKILAALLDACVRYDTEAADNAAAELGKYKYSSGGELAAWLITNTAQMNYNQIENKLNGFLNI